MMTNEAEPDDRELIYVGDPMCSWCWGIAPELEALVESHPELPLRIVVGGLRPGPTAQTVGPELAGYLAHHWEEVERRSGQPFDQALLEDHGWLYDTEHACRAVVVMRELAPHETFRFFQRLQRAFYAEGRAVWDPDIYGELIEGFDVDSKTFLTAFGSQDAIKATWQDFSLARSWGINGFPTIVLRQGSTGQIIARGYTTADDMEMVIGSLT
jgi:putative protein-disulfide isomerase